VPRTSGPGASLRVQVHRAALGLRPTGCAPRGLAPRAPGQGRISRVELRRGLAVVQQALRPMRSRVVRLRPVRGIGRRQSVGPPSAGRPLPCGSDPSAQLGGYDAGAVVDHARRSRFVASSLRWGPGSVPLRSTCPGKGWRVSRRPSRYPRPLSRTERNGASAKWIGDPGSSATTCGEAAQAF
jgi:hypothetical protein